jgi:hypothetical protein
MTISILGVGVKMKIMTENTVLIYGEAVIGLKIKILQQN